MKTWCLEGEDTGWYSGVIDTIDSENIQVYYADEDTYTEHKASDKKLSTEDGSIKFRINDAVTVQLDSGNLCGKVIQIKPKKIVVYFEDKTKKDYEHTNSTVKLDLEKTSRSFMTSRLPFQKFKKDLLKRYGKLKTKKVKKCWRKNRDKYCDRFWKKMSGGASGETEASIAFSVKTRKAVFLVKSDGGEPEIPKGFKDIQFINDAGVREKWYQAVLDEHHKSEANGTFEWIPDDEIDRLRKNGVPILRHVWVFKMKRDGKGHYTVYKARGCVDGSQQRHGFDYNETFAPTCREASFKALISFSVAMDWDVSQLDVGSAFTRGVHAMRCTCEEVYMRCPQGVHAMSTGNKRQDSSM